VTGVFRFALGRTSGWFADVTAGRVSVCCRAGWPTAIVAIRRSGSGADAQNRTADLPITNRLLYQLSYVGSRE